MLLNDFFYIQSSDNNKGSIKASLELNATHRIFEGHFPSIPIVPGVCMMEMVKELVEHHYSRKLILRTGNNLKFLSVINPTEHTKIQVDIRCEESTDGIININATLFAEAVTFFKIKATLASA